MGVEIKLQPICLPEGSVIALLGVTIFTARRSPPLKAQAVKKK
jgi:hypothetical protein